MAVHLGLPGQVFDWDIFILVAFDVIKGECYRETVEDVDDPAFQVVLGGEAVAWVLSHDWCMANSMRLIRPWLSQ